MAIPIPNLDLMLQSSSASNPITSAQSGRFGSFNMSPSTGKTDYLPIIITSVLFIGFIILKNKKRG